MNQTQIVDREMINVSKEEYEQLKNLTDRLIEDKKEMEEEFKEILSHVVEEVENREQLGELLSKKEFESFKAAGLSPEKINMTITKQEQTINDLKERLLKLENSKLGKLQRKIWAMRKK
ncbi:hypothetical protein [Rossellomorea sp. BNER]|uniref:hypothetical protein n=1 Tax=Rossellomorea sp. BNER TaxID=2962031 RepID=UPI003AF217DD|nr:hypothetical protein [Rossellomorea sp. BNER]